MVAWEIAPVASPPVWACPRRPPVHECVGPWEVKWNSPKHRVLKVIPATVIHLVWWLWRTRPQNMGEKRSGTAPVLPVSPEAILAVSAWFKASRYKSRPNGGTTHSNSGARLLGKHSLRVTGANDLQLLNVAVARIMVLACVRDAPPATFSDELGAFRRSASSCSCFARLPTPDELSRRRQLIWRRPGEPVRLEGRCMLHRVQTGSSALPSREWSATCGVRFGFWDFTSHPVSPSLSMAALCGRRFAGLPTTLGTISIVADGTNVAVFLFFAVVRVLTRDKEGWKGPDHPFASLERPELH